jgi:hypothetical protein
MSAKASKPKAGTRSSNQRPAKVLIRAKPGDGRFPLNGAEIEQKAVYWAYSVRNRARWDKSVASNNAQRLRTPSDVILGKRGTCVDLALLFTAFLEYIEIFPSLIMLNDHAFPAYWRDEEEHGRFLSEPVNHTAADVRQGTGNKEWIITGFHELQEAVRKGKLVPLETTQIASKTSFQEALDTGMARFEEEQKQTKAKWEGVVDIRKSRDCFVPPLPLVYEGS